MSSQVGKVAPSHRRAGRMGAGCTPRSALLEDPALDALLAPPVAFDDLPAQLPAILNAEADALCPLIRYPAAEMAP